MKKLAAAAAGLTIAIGLAGSADAQYMGYTVAAPSRADPAVNNYLSARYDRLLQISPRFRRYRMWKECHSITWPGLRADCLATFDQYEPALYAR